jgi:hypothetical protein
VCVSECVRVRAGECLEATRLKAIECSAGRRHVKADQRQGKTYLSLDQLRTRLTSTRVPYAETQQGQAQGTLVLVLVVPTLDQLRDATGEAQPVTGCVG